jgi:phosphohistidine phosphatase
VPKHESGPVFDSTGSETGLDFLPHRIDAAAMRRLMLLRHAKSDWSSPGMLDMMRPLNARGEAAARLMGTYLARHAMIPDRVLCSAAKRTRETLAAMTSQWPKDVKVVFEERLYAAPPQRVLSVVREQDAAVQSIMVIGHNPGLQQSAELLIAAGDVELREKLREKFPTGALAVIDFAVDAWGRIHDHSGRLDRYVTPRSIAATTS